MVSIGESTIRSANNGTPSFSPTCFKSSHLRLVTGSILLYMRRSKRVCSFFWNQALWRAYAPSITSPVSSFFGTRRSPINVSPLAARWMIKGYPLERQSSAGVPSGSGGGTSLVTITVSTRGGGGGGGSGAGAGLGRSTLHAASAAAAVRARHRSTNSERTRTSFMGDEYNGKDDGSPRCAAARSL